MLIAALPRLIVESAFMSPELAPMLVVLSCPSCPSVFEPKLQESTPLSQSGGEGTARSQPVWLFITH